MFELPSNRLVAALCLRWLCSGERGAKMETDRPTVSGKRTRQVADTDHCSCSEGKPGGSAPAPEASTRPLTRRLRSEPCIG